MRRWGERASTPGPSSAPKPSFLGRRRRGVSIPQPPSASEERAIGAEGVASYRAGGGRAGGGRAGGGPYTTLLALALTVILATAARAQERVTVEPTSVNLARARDFRQLVVTGWFGGAPRDLTDRVRLVSSNPKVARVDGARIAAAGDGAATVTATVGGKRLRIPVVVRGSARPDPVRFAYETVPILTKQGCASGSCHGSPHGKGGFSLSLFGYDPTIDRTALTRDGLARRIDRLTPEQSLLLRKPLLALPHVGGRRFRKTDTGYRVLRDWIAQGAEVESPGASVAALTVSPSGARVLQAPYKRQQLRAVARFTDGSERDVTAIATYDSSHPAVAAVDGDGRVTGKTRGYAAVSVRYLDKLVSVPLTVVEEVPGFVWKQPTESNAVDRLVGARLRQLRVSAAPTCTDAEFVRRVFLDLTGLLPTVGETRAFLADTSPDRRSRLIDRLLESDAFARFWALQQADLLRVTRRRLPDGKAEGLARWLVDATGRNVGYDRVAREILTATGDAAANPAAGYYLALPTPEERTELTAQVFLGSRVECAKCHNHPFENWTQRDYFRIAAVFARTRAEDGRVDALASGETRHPTTGEVLPPWTPTERPGDDRRAAFAQWLTRPGNPLFARVLANRIWASLLGRGIVEPVDDFRSSNPPSHPELLDFLARTLERNGYDRKALVRLICNSRTYQRSTRTDRFNAADETLFSHARPRLLTAEQLRDALGRVAGALPEPDALVRERARLAEERTKRDAALDAELPTRIAAARDALLKTPLWQGAWRMIGPFDDDPARDDGRPLRGARPVPRSDGPEIRFGEHPRRTRYLERRLRSDSARRVEVRVHAGGAATLWLNGERVGPKDFGGDRRVPLDLKPGDNRIVVKLTGENVWLGWRLDGVSADLPGAVADALTDGSDAVLVERHFRDADPRRAALTRQIAALDDREAFATQRLTPEQTPFLQTFGQPARETACTCERRQSPTLLQALELLNGRAAYDTIASAGPRWATLSDDALVDELYAAALCRTPSAAERATATTFLKGKPDRAAASVDLAWALVNTQEFLFQH